MGFPQYLTTLCRANGYQSKTIVALAGPQSHFFTSVKELEPRHIQKFYHFSAGAFVSTGTQVKFAKNQPNLKHRSILIEQVVDIKILPAGVPEGQEENIVDRSQCARNGLGVPSPLQHYSYGDLNANQPFSWRQATMVDIIC